MCFCFSWCLFWNYSAGDEVFTKFGKEGYEKTIGANLCQLSNLPYAAVRVMMVFISLGFSIISILDSTSDTLVLVAVAVLSLIELLSVSFGMIVLTPGCMKGAYAELAFDPRLTDEQYIAAFEKLGGSKPQKDVLDQRRSYRQYMEYVKDYDENDFTIRHALDFFLLEWSFYSIPAGMGLLFIYVHQQQEILLAGAVYRVLVLGFQVGKFARIKLIGGDNRWSWTFKLTTAFFIATAPWLILLKSAPVTAIVTLLIVIVICSGSAIRTRSKRKSNDGSVKLTPMEVDSL